MQFGGQTALYDAAVDGIELAAQAPFPRRTMILLSDGAEYGGASVNPREAGPDLSPVRGVPVYTIGLGFGTDRSYLEALAESSSALLRVAVAR
ncbi:MAG: VWA domain-containing protein [Chloroflexi bacterium]|nr:VWA domain-containing protein [Chloroflexota bacterium]